MLFFPRKVLGKNHYARGGRDPGRRVDCASPRSSFLVRGEKSTVARARQERPMIPGPRRKATSNKNQQAAKTQQRQKATSHKHAARSESRPATKTKQQQTPASNQKQAQQTLSINLPQSDSDWGKFHLTFVGWPRREN